LGFDWGFAYDLGSVSDLGFGLGFVFDWDSRFVSDWGFVLIGI